MFPSTDRHIFDQAIDTVAPDSAVFVNKPGEDANRPRKFAIGGNWKCNGGVESVDELVKILNTGKATNNVDVLVFPPSIFLGKVNEQLNNNYLVGAQNVAKDCYGAYTGEVCAPMLKDFGIQWTITGHSERRDGFGAEGESSDLVAEKTKVAIDNGMNVVPCVGEKLEDREADKTMDVIISQLKPLAEKLDEADWDKVILAYEPVWAIGTGKVATPEQAQEVHKEIREWIAENVSEKVAKNLRIQYGGSVKGESAPDLILQPDIDGFLVGGASLTEDFLTIIDAAESYEP
jgi:triosephosphate isomerase